VDKMKSHHVWPTLEKRFWLPLDKSSIDPLEKLSDAPGSQFYPFAYLERCCCALCTRHFFKICGNINYVVQLVSSGCWHALRGRDRLGETRHHLRFVCNTLWKLAYVTDALFFCV